MADTPLVIRVAANLDTLRANLAEGVNQIETTSTAMRQMATAYDGSRAIAQAGAVMAAIQGVGGATNLTAAEQAKANTILDAAIQKYAALGQEAPPGMQKLADETKQADVASSGLMDTVKSLALSFAAMFTARAAFNFVKDTINEASALKDLSQQTHINVEDLQLLAGAMSEFGVDADTLGKGLYKLSRGIAGGDESVAAGLHLMGMSLKDVEGLQGKELFLKIESGLATLQGGLRDTAAAELFGGKLGAAMAGASEGIEDALATWQRFNHVASTESVDAMDKFGESIARSNKNLSSIAANMIGPVAQGFNVLYEATNKGASKWDIFVAMTQDLAVGFGRTGTSTEHLATLLDHLNQKTDENTKSTAAATDEQRKSLPVLDAKSQAIKFMAALEADAAVALSASQVKNLEHLKEIGALTAKNAEGIGVNAEQFKKYEAGLQAAKKAAEDLSKAEAIADAIVMTAYEKRIKTLETLTQSTIKAYGFDGQIAALQALGAAEDDLSRHVYDQLTSEQARAKVLEEVTARHVVLSEQITAIRLRDMALVNAGVVEAFEKQTAYNKSIGLDAAGAVAVATPALDALTDRLRAIGEMHTTEAAKATLADLAEKAYGKTIADEAAALQDAYFAQLKKNEELAKVPALVKAAADAQVDLTKGSYMVPTGDSLTKAGFVASTITFGSDISALNGLTSRDGGGPVAANQPYVIGKGAQPELFVPTSAGTMYPAGSYGSGGSQIVNVYVTQPLGTSAAIAAAVGDALMSVQRGQGARFSMGV